MKILYTPGGEYGDCIVKHFDLNVYDDGNTDNVLFWGWQSLDNNELKDKYENSKNKIFLNTAMPCEIVGGFIDVLKQYYFDNVYTICPYTANVLNGIEDKMSNTVFTPMCFPYPEKYFEKYNNISISDKTHDIIYYGQVHHTMYKDLLRTISNHNHLFSTISQHGLDSETEKLITHFNLSSQEKWDLISKAKINVGINLIFLRPDQIENLKSIENINAFKNIDKAYEKAMLPQMKTRMVEAAACKTLMLIYKDEWNVIEEWFEPNTHFLYWETFEQLDEMIAEISNNYEKYWHIVEAAHQHVKQYSIQNLIKQL